MVLMYHYNVSRVFARDMLRFIGSFTTFFQVKLEKIEAQFQRPLLHERDRRASSTPPPSSSPPHPRAHFLHTAPINPN